jgi:adenylate kinase
MKYRTILLFGAPGSGKGTQGKILGSIPGYFHCACGDVFRSLKTDSNVGRIFLEYSSRGALVPDEPTVNLWRYFIDGSTKTGRFRPDADVLVLDGIPRNLPQAEMLQNDLDVKAVFYLGCRQEQVLIERLQRRALKENRLDDANLDTIRQRLVTYERESRPVLDFYDPKVLRHLDAGQSPAKVFLDILNEVVKIQPA